MTEFVFEPPLRLARDVTVRTLDDAADFARTYVGPRLPRRRDRLVRVIEEVSGEASGRAAAHMFRAWALAEGLRASKASTQPLGETSKASTQPLGEALSPKHEAFVQAYIINLLNGAKAYREVYPNCKSAHAAEQAASRLLKNVEVAARIAEIMAVGAERAEVTAEEIIRELKKLGFSCIGNVVDWRNEVITQELEEGQEGEPKSVLIPRVTIVPRAELQKATLDAIAEVSQQTNGALRVKMHDKHAALVSLGKHLGLFSDTVQIKAVYGIRDKPMSAEEWKKQFVKPG